MTHPDNAEPIFAGRHVELWLDDRGQPAVYLNAPLDLALTPAGTLELLADLDSVLAHVEQLGELTS